MSPVSTGNQLLVLLVLGLLGVAGVGWTRSGPGLIRSSIRLNNRIRPEVRSSSNLFELLAILTVIIGKGLALLGENACNRIAGRKNDVCV